MSIIGSFPTTLANGQPEDATQVMSLFSWIQSQVNGNACAATTTTNVLKGDGSGNTTMAVAGTDYVVPNSDYLAISGTANVYSGNYPGLVALVDGLKLRFKTNLANTGASTFNPNSLGAKPIVDYEGNALVGGELISNGNAELTYNSAFNSGNGAWVLNLLETQLAIFLGTMSTQNSNAVSITGGTLNGVVINGATSINTSMPIFATSPNSGSSGGVVVKQNASGGNCYIQFTNNAVSSEFGDLSVSPSGLMNLTAPGGLTLNGGSVIKGLGLGGESWHAVSRSFNTVYTNSASYPIMVLFSWATPSSSGAVQVFVNGLQINGQGDTGNSYSMTFIVPAGQTYEVTSSGSASLSSWSELY